jgi:hypothetical protein
MPKKILVRDIAAEAALVASAFPDAFSTRGFVEGLGEVEAIFSPSAQPTHLMSGSRSTDHMPMLFAADGVLLPDGTAAAVLSTATRAVGWLPVLRALKVIEPQAYAALLDVVNRMTSTFLATGRDPDQDPLERAEENILAAELKRFSEDE